MAELVSGLKTLGIPLSTWHVRALAQLLPDSAVLSRSLFLQVCLLLQCVRLDVEAAIYQTRRTAAETEQET